eukprot:11157196-Alexandrium_andersonii.AAC.1
MATCEQAQWRSCMNWWHTWAECSEAWFTESGATELWSGFATGAYGAWPTVAQERGASDVRRSVSAADARSVAPLKLVNAWRPQSSGE